MGRKKLIYCNDYKLYSLYKKGWLDRNWYQNAHHVIYTIMRHDAPLFVDLLAITSINTSVIVNFRLAIKAYQQITLNQPIKGYLSVVKDKIQQLLHTHKYVGLKINNFAANLKGDFNKVVVDRWVLRIFFPDAFHIRRRLTQKRYDMIQQVIRQKARKYNLYPAQYQAAIWKGIRETYQQKFVQFDNFPELFSYYRLQSLQDVLKFSVQ